MAHTGPPAKAAKHGRTPTNSEWIDVPDLPFDEESPGLPKLGGRKKWHSQVEAWWEEIRTMPHCRAWTVTDWRFAIDTAFMKEQLWRDIDDGEMKATLATEIRRREDQLGTTIEARRKLRIRYLDPSAFAADEDQADEAGAAGDGGADNVTSISSRRARLTA